MLVIVLCRFSVPVVKLKLNFLPKFLSGQWWTTTPNCLTELPSGEWRYCSDFRETLIKTIASCLETKSAIDFWHEIEASSHQLTRKVRGNSCLAYPLVKTHPAKLEKLPVA